MKKQYPYDPSWHYTQAAIFALRGIGEFQSELQDIADRLNDGHLKTKDGQPWTPELIVTTCKWHLNNLLKDGYPAYQKRKGK